MHDLQFDEHDATAFLDAMMSNVQDFQSQHESSVPTLPASAAGRDFQHYAQALEQIYQGIHARTGESFGILERGSSAARAQVVQLAELDRDNARGF